MSGTSNEDVQDQGLVDSGPQGHAHNELPQEEIGHVDKNEENLMPTAEEEEKVIKKKYGGIIPKKKPLISKDHERAFFDSADWALGKGAKPKNPLEALRPKLQPTPHNQGRSRRSAYAPADGEGEDIHNAMDSSTEDHDSGDDDKNNHVRPDDPIQGGQS